MRQTLGEKGERDQFQPVFFGEPLAFADQCGVSRVHTVKIAECRHTGATPVAGKRDIFHLASPFGIFNSTIIQWKEENVNRAAEIPSQRKEKKNAFSKTSKTSFLFLSAAKKEKLTNT